MKNILATCLLEHEQSSFLAQVLLVSLVACPGLPVSLAIKYVRQHSFVGQENGSASPICLGVIRVEEVQQNMTCQQAASMLPDFAAF